MCPRLYRDGGAMENGDLVKKVAADFVQRFGADAVRLLRESAEEADKHNDMPSAEAWRDIADEAELLIN